ncbi:MAG: type IV secretory system conjugative DNA transfer family protein [Clostridiales bacterium]|jgi:type IV secretory pathway TraG/TraD family ATPase VirD4|nr:type IV secretory system conjugative DNA transfer family protein [Clostridiales bacterium]
MSRTKAEKIKNGGIKKRNPFVLLLFALPLFITLFLTFAFISGGARFSVPGFLTTLENPLFYMISIAAFAGLLIYGLATFRLAEKKNVLKENDLADSRFMTDRELVRSPSFVLTDISNLDKYDDGIPIRAVVKGKKTRGAFLQKPIHVNVIGATGTGKTTGFIDPVIQIFPRFKSKPCLIVTDPKGEL